MCGIIGYVGKKDAASALIEGLYKLEYRGYDSAGLSVYDSASESILTEKKAGRISVLDGAASELKGRGFYMGIAHTRWATHGEPSDRNSHPHSDGHGKLSLVHNGIIENYAELKEQLIAEGEVFLSETDTEVAAKLLGKNYSGDPLDAISKTMKLLKGSYAFAIIFSDCPNKVYAAKKDSPLLCGIGKGENYLASDATAFMSKTSDYIALKDMQIAELSENSVCVYTAELVKQTPEILKANWDAGSAELNGYSCYMEKEINEQPEVAKRVISGRVKDGMPDFSGENVDIGRIARAGKIHIVACGTAMHAGLFAKSVFEKLARIPVEVSLASEFRYCDPILSENDFAFVISQSGETADTLAALRLLKEKEIPTAAVVNVVGSTIAREADAVLYTDAGPEIAVASTKAYFSQALLLSLLALDVTYCKYPDKKDVVYKYTSVLTEMPKFVLEIVSKAEKAETLASEIMNDSSLFFIGRGIDYAAICEASLKLKEISYIHSEAYAAGELKHGTISLISPQTHVIALATEASLFDKMGSNIKEVASRGAKVHLITVPEGKKLAENSDGITVLPDGAEIFAPILAVVFCQFLAMYTAKALGQDVDKPRNLAKSVTVE